MVLMTDDNPTELADPDFSAITAMLDENLARIRTLNDELRVHHRGGVIVITPGLAGLGPALFGRVLRAVAEFDGFCPDNDPHGEHDCAIVTVDDVRVIWKIDYYDLKRLYHSPDPTDERVTRRVLTIMRADEY